jgi:hypothetical protein
MSIIENYAHQLEAHTSSLNTEQKFLGEHKGMGMQHKLDLGLVIYDP